MKDKDLLKLLEKNGWVEERIKGSHHVMKKDGKLRSSLFMEKTSQLAY